MSFPIKLFKNPLVFPLLLAGLSLSVHSCNSNGNSANATNSNSLSATVASESSVNASNNSNNEAAENTTGATRSTDSTAATIERTATPAESTAATTGRTTTLTEGAAITPKRSTEGTATSAERAEANYREAEQIGNKTKKEVKKVKAKRLKAVAVEKFPHDKYAYTQGLFFENGVLYESCGQYGRSDIRTVDIKTGKTLGKKNLDSKYFAEGSVIHGGNLYLLTWREQVCLVYEPSTFKKIGELRYSGEGWGLTTDGKELIMSNGSASLTFLDPMTFMESRKIDITLNGKPVEYLNELEYIEGEIWANVYLEDYIITINPQTGYVTSVIDCTEIYPAAIRSAHADVLNGIAYNKADGSIYITGKYWPELYRIKVTE